MSDDEETFQSRSYDREDSPPAFQASPARSPARSPEQSPEPQKRPPPPEPQEGGKSEAELIMEEKRRKDLARQEEELQEYYEMRKEEKERIDNEIAELKEKRAERLKEREEEEQKMAQLRQEQDEQRRADEAERQRKKNEELEKKMADREAKQREAEERSMNQGKRNFEITRKNKDGEIETVTGDAKPKSEQKSKEQLEAEKRATLESRIAPLGDVQSMSEEDLKAKAKELHQHLLRLESDKYDLEQTFKQRQYEMNELAERARSMNKGKGKKTVQAENDPIAEKFSGVPPKILLCSKYERHTDRRTYVERKDVFGGPMYGEEAPRILPGQGAGKGGGEEGGEEED